MNLFRPFRTIALAVLTFAVTLAAHGQCVSLTTLGSAYTQNFDTLLNVAGSTTNTLTIPGWFMTESGGGARDNEQYAVDTGASTTGDTYSYGAAASTDRALGQLRSGTLIPIFGACFTNNSGSAITSLDVAYAGEEWRLGTAARTDQMNFEYSTNATDLVTGTWTNVAALNFVTPDTATTGAKNGNAAADRTAKSSTISSLNIPNGATFWIRWNDTDATGADDGLAVDDVSLTPQNGVADNPPAITPPSDPIATVAENAAPFAVTVSGADDGSVFNWSATPGTGVQSVSVAGGQGTATVTYTVTLQAGYTGTATFTATLSDNVNTAVNQAVNITVNAPVLPAAPTGLSATPGDAHVSLTWNTVPGATSYNVKRSVTSGSGYAPIASPTTNSYDDTTAVDGTTYYYVVSAVGAGGEGSNSSEASATPAAPSGIPTGLAAIAGDSQVSLSWNSVSGATSYNVKRSTTNGSGYLTIASPTTASYLDTTVTNGTTYYYVVSTNSAGGESADSPSVSATPAPAPPAPTGVTIAVGDSNVVLSWTAVGGATSYNVKRGTITGSYTTTTNTAATTFTDTTVANGTAYFYVVTAVNGAESTPSSEVSGTPNAASSLGLVISQVYGGGGNGGATLKNDFIELFNRGAQTISLTGFYVHYASATLTTAWNSPPAAGTTPTALSGTIAPGHYYLIGESAGAGGTADLPTPDATGTLALGAGAGKVALSTASSLSVQCPTGMFIADFVGYGPTANCSEGSPTAAPANATGVLRANDGCTDTNNNSTDFAVGTPNPRNSATAPLSCGAAANNPPTINAPANPIATVLQDAAPFGVNLTGNDDNGVYNWSATAGTGVSSVIVSSGQGTSSVTYTVTLVSGFTGTASFTASLTDNVNTAVTQTVNIQVNSTGGGDNAPTINPPANPIKTVVQESPAFTVALTGNDDHGAYTWSATPGTGVASVSVTGGQGTGSVTYTVLVQSGFTGTATFTASLSDGVNPAAMQAVNITVTPNVAPSHLVISQLYGGGGNSGATYQNDFVEVYNPSSTTVNTAGWSIQYASATGTSWQVQPLGGLIAPGEYYLISLGSGGATGSVLPTANILGSLNLSGTTGKVALVNDGTALPSCSAATIVDLVGYGTADCHEGAADAPAPSNTTSLFRKNGGATDSDQNGNDFTTGTPNPRRTTPIQEVGPSILSIDGTDSYTKAPRDGSVTVNFSEAVDVDPDWFSLNCVTSGAHTDVTSAGSSDKKTWVITPNVNYTAGEQCTVTIFATKVHDSDTDDSGPGTDTLPADKSLTFTVSSGGTEPETAAIHLAMGNPSSATTDVSNPNNYLMMKPEMAESYNRDKGAPNWVSWHLSSAWTSGASDRTDTFRPDPTVPPEWYRVQAFDFSGSGFDRGHMDPSADRTTSEAINEATFVMANMVAQAPDNNQGPWEALESDLRALLPANELFVVAGPQGQGGVGSNGGVTNTLAGGKVVVPANTWKCALVLPAGSGDPVARVTASTRTICVVMPNAQGIRSNDWHIYLKSVDQVEALVGYDLFSNVPAAIQNAVEGGVDGANPPGAADQSVSTQEDSATSFTLDIASPNANPLTYTIVTGPSHGQLTGTNGSETYTPVPDFNGTDTFTYDINDGTRTSNTATVTITILEKNDPPVATADTKSTASNTPLVFPAVDLTTNDSAGPANESTQTLTVTSVTATATTHGTVTLSSGNVTYTPAVNYTGSADFTYQVCDNGFTAGLSDSLCATSTVNLTVAAAQATHFGLSAPANGVAGTAFSVSVTALDASNATVTGYTGTVHFTSSTSGTLPGDYTFVAGDNGTHTFSVTLNGSGLQSVTATDTVTPSITGTASINLSIATPTVSIVGISPASGSSFGGRPVVLTGSGFAAGATVTFGGVPATGVTVVDASHINATTPAHAAGAVDVTVTNSDSSSATLLNGYTYVAQQFDPNGDDTIDPSDIFYLVNYLFTGGPAPAGGTLSGDANGDGQVDPADIFYLVNYLFGGGAYPQALPPGTSRKSESSVGRLAGAISLGTPQLRDGRWLVPVIVASDADIRPQAMALTLHFEGGDAANASIRRAGAVPQPLFETSRSSGDALTYLVAFDDRTPLPATAGGTVIAELELDATHTHIRIDPALTMLVDRTAQRQATAGNGALRLTGATIRIPGIAGPQVRPNE